MMRGVQCVVDEHGKKTAVQIDLREHGELWEDVYDSWLAREREDDPRESLAEVEQFLKAEGKLTE